MATTTKGYLQNKLFSKSAEAGIGPVIRNERSEVMASLAEKVNKPSGGVEAIEAISVWRAVLLAIELGFQQCVVEGDSGIVFKALSREGSDRSGFGHIIKDCKSIMGLLKTYSFSNVKRKGNGVTHALVRRAKKSFPLLVWMEFVLSDISFLVHIDVIP